ncbi:hypothetical protein DQ04_07141040 [Trypanosoma grayi]|uniref:hypothetical protein n=1 Tax=Trypanosoma grayi TaxID=71804 RepID=UPI0004F46B38|nr:hypothetical protein DQ04_07141040 [Trypanosoma grayi]KEG08461.1 hypothetical protein DQ04_07141040 [Trypanosoma grayi]
MSSTVTSVAWRGDGASPNDCSAPRTSSMMRKAMSPVPPATSRNLPPGRGRTHSRTKCRFHTRCTPSERTSFIMSYRPATLSNTFLT